MKKNAAEIKDIEAGLRVYLDLHVKLNQMQHGPYYGGRRQEKELGKALVLAKKAVRYWHAEWGKKKEEVFARNVVALLQNRPLSVILEIGEEKLMGEAFSIEALKADKMRQARVKEQRSDIRRIYEQMRTFLKEGN